MNAVFKKNKLLQENASFKSSILICTKQLWKLWSNYIIVFLIFVFASLALGRNNWTTATDVVFDALGLAYFFSKPTMNATWWYMGTAIIAYASTPIFAFLVRKHKEIAIGGTAICFALLFYFCHISFWTFFYYFGFLFADTNFFSFIQEHRRNNKLKSLLMWSALLALFVYLRHVYGIVADLFLGSCVIVFSYLFFSKIKIASNFLHLLGRHSGNIFMFHSFFIYSFPNFDIKKLVFSLKYVPIIFIPFAFLTLGPSIILELIKKQLCLNKFIFFARNNIFKGEVISS